MLRCWKILATVGCALFAGGAAAQVTCPAGPPPVPVVDCGNPEFQSCGIDVGGIPRHFCIHVPAAPPPVPAAGRSVVIAFHGRGGQANRAVNWVDHLTEQGIILVAPTALPTTAACVRRWRHLRLDIPGWADLGVPDACATATGPWPANSPNGHDLDFIGALMIAINAQFNVQDFYALGFSSGAGMALQLLITEPFASQIAGFGLIANGITDEKATAQSGGGGFGAYSANADTHRPVILIWGTADKVSFPGQQMIEAVTVLNTNGVCPSVATPEEVVACFMQNPMAPGLAQNEYRSRIRETADWLIAFNNAETRAIEGAYPDRGHGMAPPALHDATVAVRRDYPAAPGEGEPVTVITIIDGAHAVPGVAGDHAPCSAQNCDIRGIDEILHFWRANAGFQNLWP